MLQYITDITSPVPVEQQVMAVIEGGCRWVQIKMDGASDEEIRKVVEAVKPVCVEKEVFLIMHNRVDLAKEFNMGGVHLEKGSTPCSKARMELGPAAVIGVSVNNMADVLAVSALDIDYFALTPFASDDKENTEMKPLGIEGTAAICNGMLENDINIAHVAAGGITFEDIPELLKTGINGVAVGKAIAHASDIKTATEKFVAALPAKEGN